MISGASDQFGFSQGLAPMREADSSGSQQLELMLTPDEAQTAADIVGDDRELSTDPSFDWPSQRDAADDPNSGRVIDRITDPISWLMNFRFRESWSWPTDDSDLDSEQFQFRPTIPFKAWGHENILRVTVPYDISGSGAPGLGDVIVLDLVVHQASWGRWGIGPVFRFTPESGSGDDTFQVGPAAGAVSKNKHWTVGFLTQNFLSDDVSQSRLQPILVYKFNDQWAVGVGDFEFEYDWDDSEWTQVPIGIEVDYIADIYGQKLQFFVNPQYNLQDDASNSGWTLFLGMALIVPES
jgi:hypothetical protein